MKRRGLIAAAGLAALPAQAQEFPRQPVRMIATSAPGGSIDVVARIVTPSMGEALGRPVLVENRGGGGGVIAAEMVANAPPDGHVIGIFTVSAGVLNAGLYRTLRFNTRRAFAPISLINTMPMLLTVGNHVPARTLAELVALMQARPGRLTYGSSGPGSINHMSAHLLNTRSGTTAEHIPFRGAGPAITAMISGDTDFLIEGIASQAPFVRQGTIRALAVTSKERSAVLPDVPTVEEAGIADFEILNWMALFAPVATPAPVVRRLQDATQGAVRDAATNARLRAAGVEPVGSTAAELEAFWDAQFRLWAPVVAASGVVLE